MKGIFSESVLLKGANICVYIVFKTHSHISGHQCCAASDFLRSFDDQRVKKQHFFETEAFVRLQMSVLMSLMSG